MENQVSLDFVPNFNISGILVMTNILLVGAKTWTYRYKRSYVDVTALAICDPSQVHVCRTFYKEIVMTTHQQDYIIQECLN